MYSTARVMALPLSRHVRYMRLKVGERKLGEDGKSDGNDDGQTKLPQFFEKSVHGWSMHMSDSKVRGTVVVYILIRVWLCYSFKNISQ